MIVDVFSEPVKNFMRTIKRAGILFSVMILLLVCIACFFISPDDNFTKLFLFLASLVLIVIAIWPTLMYARTSNMQIFFDSDSMQIRYKNGKGLRTVYYTDIKCIKVNEIQGFFYGDNDKLSSKYICIYLSQKIEVPSVSFKKLFYQEDFVLFNYTSSAFQFITDKLGMAITIQEVD